jgi:hypothetical protein
MTLLWSCKSSCRPLSCSLKVNPYHGRPVVFGAPRLLERRAVTTVCPRKRTSRSPIFNKGRLRIAIIPHIVRRMNTAVLTHMQALSDTPYPLSSASTPFAGTTASHSLDFGLSDRAAPNSFDPSIMLIIASTRTSRTDFSFGHSIN